MNEREFKTPLEEYQYHLEEAEKASRRALDMLYSPVGVKRPLWYRMTLGKAQNALISLIRREYAWKNRKLRSKELL